MRESERLEQRAHLGIVDQPAGGPDEVLKVGGFAALQAKRDAASQAARERQNGAGA